MPDVFSTEKRSQIMKSIKSRNNKSTEMKLIAFFNANHITGWRRNYKVKGHPDFVFLNKKVAVFVDGCFWHGHNCRNVTPKQNSDYWDKKRKYNMEHDREITSLFESRGWHVIRIWECELKLKNRSLLEQKLGLLLLNNNDNGKGEK